MSSSEDEGEGQIAILSDIAADISLIRVNLGITCAAKVVGRAGLDGEADLLASIPFGVPEVRQC